MSTLPPGWHMHGASMSGTLQLTLRPDTLHEPGWLTLTTLATANAEPGTSVKFEIGESGLSCVTFHLNWPPPRLTSVELAFVAFAACCVCVAAVACIAANIPSRNSGGSRSQRLTLLTVARLLLFGEPVSRRRSRPRSPHRRRSPSGSGARRAGAARR